MHAVCHLMHAAAAARNTVGRRRSDSCALHLVCIDLLGLRAAQAERPKAVAICRHERRTAVKPLKAAALPAA